MTVQWVPSHCGIAGNDVADTLAALGSAETQIGMPLAHDVAKAAIRRSTKIRWNCAKEHVQTEWHATAAGILGSHIHSVDLNRSHAVTVTQLRTGHCPILMNYLHRVGRAASPTCPHCHQEEDSAEHFLIRCPALQSLRGSVFGEVKKEGDHKFFRTCGTASLFSVSQGKREKGKKKIKKKKKLKKLNKKKKN